MKTYLISTGFGLAIALVPFLASANTFTLNDGTVLGCDQATTTPTPSSCLGGNSDPMQLSMPWGSTGYDTPTQVAGSIVVDEHGLTYPCIGDMWHGCFDLTHTDYYRAQMRETVRQLLAFFGSKAQAIANFPTFKGWINAQ